MANDWDKTHYLYSKFAKQWSRIRDVLDGSDTVKSAGEIYLPRLSGQNDTDYDAYVGRATFFNMAGRVYGANIGMVTRRSPTVELPSEMDVYLNDASGLTSFYELFVTTIKEITAIGRVGVLIDIKNDFPSPVVYQSESIKHWTHSDTGELTSVTLFELIYPDGETSEDRTLVLSLKPDSNGIKVYTVDTYIDGVHTSTVIPKYKGVALEFIPFVCGNTFGISMDPVKSPILDIVDMNISHYRTSADYEHGLHFVALPTPVFTGVTLENAVKLGSSQGIVLPPKDAKAYYLEFQGQGLSALQKALADKQSQISLFSARLQDTNTKGSEAENTVRLRYAADSASLTDVALSTELILNKVFDVIATWLNIEPSFIIDLNKDFISTKLSPQELKELAAAYVEGAMDDATYIYNLERGEMTKPGHSIKLPKKTETETETQTDEISSSDNP